MITIDWEGRLRLWAANPVQLSRETLTALADEMARLKRENAQLNHEKTHESGKPCFHGHMWECEFSGGVGGTERCTVCGQVRDIPDVC